MIDILTKAIFFILWAIISTVSFFLNSNEGYVVKYGAILIFSIALWQVYSNIFKGVWCYSLGVVVKEKEGKNIAYLNAKYYVLSIWIFIIVSLLMVAA